jgi:hypothetical protein
MNNFRLQSPVWMPALFVFFIFCQSRQERWHKMSENTLVVHTDTVPHFYPVEKFAIYDICETKLAHTIATNALYDVICLFQLNEDDAKITRLTENLPSGISGGDVSPTPLFSDEWIAYGQTRGFTRYNLRTHEFHDQMICTRLEEVVKACRALDPKKNIFVFMICNMEQKNDRRFFKTFDLSGEKPIRLASMEAGKISDSDRGQTLAVRDSVIFYHNEETGAMVALDFQLQPTSHPFQLAFNEHKKLLFQLSHMAINPHFPVAFVESTIPGLISWKDNKKDFIPFPYIQKNLDVSNFYFSLDGKRLAWISSSSDYPPTSKPQFWVSRVDENIPGFIGPPQLLGSIFSEDADIKAMVWAENPYTLVVSVMDGLYWWHVQ